MKYKITSYGVLHTLINTQNIRVNFDCTYNMCIIYFDVRFITA